MNQVQVLCLQSQIPSTVSRMCRCCLLLSRFLLNVVLHKGIFNQHQLTSGFTGLLRSQPESINVAALEHICSYRHSIFSAEKRLKSVQEWLIKNPKLIKAPKQTDDVVQIRRLIITPTKAYCLPPEVELSNRVLRH